MATGPGYALGEIANVLNARLEGDPTRIVTGVAPLDSAGPGEISFLIDARHRAAARASRAGALVAEPGVDGLPAAVLRTARPQQALIDLMRLFHPPASRSPGVHPTAVVAADVRIDATAGVGPLAVIEAGATVGPRVRIHALVYVGPGVEIGEDSEIHPHVTLRGGSGRTPPSTGRCWGTPACGAVPSSTISFRSGTTSTSASTPSWWPRSAFPGRRAWVAASSSPGRSGWPTTSRSGTARSSRMLTRRLSQVEHRLGREERTGDAAG